VPLAVLVLAVLIAVLPCPRARRRLRAPARFAGKFSNLYPESLYKLYVINAPFIFSGVWGAISVFIHPVTAAKINVLSNPKYAIADLTEKLGAKLDVAFIDVRRVAAVARARSRRTPPFRSPHAPALTWRPLALRPNGPCSLRARKPTQSMC
jgi:hypothetical protein